MKIAFANAGLPKSGIVCVGVLEGRKLTESAKALDKLLNGAVSNAVRKGRFKGKKGQSVTIPAPVGSNYDMVCIVGLGDPKKLDALAAQEIGGDVYAGVATSGFKALTVCVDEVPGAELAPANIAAEMGFGARLRSYRFDKYLTKKEENGDGEPAIGTVTVATPNAAKARKIYGDYDKIADGVFLTRDLVSEPANILSPDALAKEAKKLTKLGVKVTVLGEAQMKKLGMGALLGVAQGSTREPKLVVMEWDGTSGSKKGKNAQPIAFIGKGVCFDSGGISIKPAAGMEDMKWDMGGAGVVTGLMKALAGRKAKVHAVGVIGCVENMPDGNAQRPGDIVTSMSGRTIEVLNTDAEGRLVLADAIHYTRENYKPRLIVDLATLTGAIIVALGSHRGGMYATDDELADRLLACGDKVGEHVWRMPLGDEYDKMLKSDAADMKNISGGGGAGSVTAAQFLKRFVGDTPWAHLDIAGVTWSKEAKPTVPKGGTAFGVRLLDRMVSDYYEGK